MPLKVTLNNPEQKLVESISLDRRHYDKKVKRTDQLQADKKKARFIEINGLGGEIAVAKALNLYPDINTEDISRFDILLPNGKKLEIKTTEYPHGKLIVRKKNAADIYVLVTGVIPDYTIVGYIFKKDLDLYKTEELNKGTAYVVEQDKLRPIEDLISEYYQGILQKYGYHEAIQKRPPVRKPSRSRNNRGRSPKQI
jgi:hypothetical protein